MRIAQLMMMLLLCSLSSANYADHYTSMNDANDPPSTFEGDPATTTDAYSAEPVEDPAVPFQQPAITVTPQVEKNSMTDTPDTHSADDQPTNDEPTQDTSPPSDDVGTTPSQPS